MSVPERKLTEAQKNAIAFLKRPKPSLDDWWRGQCEVEEAAEKARYALAKIGAEMPDGTVFAGMTADGKQQIFVIPTDLSLTFNGAVDCVKVMNTKNAYGHNDWQIPSLESLRVLYKNQNEGSLKSTFNTSRDKRSGSDCFDWHWSSTKHRDYPSAMHNVRFSDGGESWHPKGLELSCRPVRLVAPTP